MKFGTLDKNWFNKAVFNPVISQMYKMFTNKITSAGRQFLMTAERKTGEGTARSNLSFGQIYYGIPILRVHQMYWSARL